ncbi:flagellar biosynthesis anti-sigma factor FlgM [Microbulbifer sp. SH-1]|uniref:flagellar biosynthesis anti-sigma factor FlgM n=1 Tax=Microbulbifer sp. SH-1 TaxID=2681547 RepID=UPI00140D8A75|nr:flagellar biosynthesis anti-sigma factor FlgM [Microbulbifer sp. SH-1]QIL89909.1 flagellar biosynthesis anti-sigma factor FlgM [Microbulbifer sp. SH-1]
MKIHNITQFTPAGTLREKQPSGQAESAKPTGTADATANVSALPQQGQDNHQDIDMVRVEELRQAISSGKFEIRAERIADALIASLQEQIPADTP